MMYGYGYGGWFGPILMGVTAVLFWVLVVTVLVALVRYIRSPERAADARPPDGGATRVLDERFARGEIDEDDYARRRAVLEKRS